MKTVEVKKCPAPVGQEWVTSHYKEPGLYEDDSGRMFVAYKTVQGSDSVNVMQIMVPLPTAQSQGSGVEVHRFLDQLIALKK